MRYSCLDTSLAQALTTAEHVTLLSELITYGEGCGRMSAVLLCV